MLTVNKRSRFSLAAGITFLILGTLFLADSLGYFAMRASYVLPMVVIAIGITVATGKTRLSITWDGRRRPNDESQDPKDQAGPAAPGAWGGSGTDKDPPNVP